MKDDGLIKRERYLRPDYIPDKLVNREEIEKVRKLLLPVHRKSNPVLIYGETGSGKTVSVKKLLQELGESASVDTVYIDCWEYRTKTAVLVKILIDLGVPVPRKGKPNDVLYEKVERQVRSMNLVVALDDIGLPEIRKGEILHTVAELNGLGMGLILTTRKLSQLSEMDDSLKVRIAPAFVSFRHYTAEEISEIIRDRADKAMDGAVSNESVRRISKISAYYSGNYKLAVALLELSARSADTMGKKSVTADDVDSVSKDLKPIFGDDFIE